MANIIKGNQDGEGGRNETYSIPGRSASIPRKVLVEEVKAGKHENFSTYTIDGEDFVRANPNRSETDNVNG